MAIQNTGYQRATELKIKQGSNERVYSLLDGFSIEKEVTAVKYGFLYNWWATQEQGGGVNIIPAAMASEGWAVPTDANFTTLATYLGGESVAGGKLKETGFEYWNEPNTGATNEVYFNARGSGIRIANESGRLEGIPLVDFSMIKYGFISISKNELYEILFVSDSNNMEINQTVIETNDFVKTVGFSVRPVRPATAAEQLLPDGEIDATYTGNDGKIYRCTKIGTQVWLADNLAETKWSDGSWIAGYDGGTYTPITDANWAALTTAALCAYDDDESNVLGTGTAKTTYPALTATELAQLSISEFNARVTAFLQYVSEQEGMEISDVITNSERVQNETACPIPTPGEMYSIQITTTGVGVPGEITKDPDALLYTSGTVVTVTAADNPPNGYFVRWEVYELGTWTTHTTNYSFDVTVIQNYSFRAVYSDMAQ